MPKIVLEGFDSRWTNDSANQTKIKAWFGDAVNWEGLSDQLTKNLEQKNLKT
ncbi:VlhA.4.02 variable lipoprotein family protein [Mycoplasma synoviae GX11-T]|nr:VlhA.4.02 variable lipoprotein family protein [Mycoplasmopsis synoviae GX11-T]